MINAGETVTITYTTKYMYTFDCDIELTAFPFDIQSCVLNITLMEVPGTSCMPQWNETSNVISKPIQTIDMFFVSKFRYDVIHDESNRSQVNIFVKLERRYYSYLCTTYLPCTILLILGDLTLMCFRIDDFTDKITITLSLLIVVASIFSQTVSTQPTSPSTKSVELFFFFVIMHLAYVFIIHTVVDVLITRANSPKKARNSPLKVKVASATEKEKDSDISSSWQITKKVDLIGYENGTHQVIPRNAVVMNSFGIVTSFVMDIVFMVVIAFVVLESRANRLNIYNMGKE